MSPKHRQKALIALNILRAVSAADEFTKRREYTKALAITDNLLRAVEEHLHDAPQELHHAVRLLASSHGFAAVRGAAVLVEAGEVEEAVRLATEAHRKIGKLAVHEACQLVLEMRDVCAQMDALRRAAGLEPHDVAWQIALAANKLRPDLAADA